LCPDRPGSVRLAEFVEIPGIFGVFNKKLGELFEAAVQL